MLLAEIRTMICDLAALPLLDPMLASSPRPQRIASLGRSKALVLCCMHTRAKTVPGGFVPHTRLCDIALLLMHTLETPHHPPGYHYMASRA